MSKSGEKFQDLRRLPPFPAIATKLLRVLSEEDAEVRKIVDLIRADAALSSELLRIVNSPLYGVQAQVSSIHKAVMLLGLETVRQFALTVSMKGFLCGDLRLDVLRGIWRHSLACGTVCEELSRACPTSQGRDDRAYTAGLLHDVGRLGMFVTYTDRYAAIVDERPPRNPLEREREVFGFDHCEAGAWLAQSWGLPEEIRTVIAGHHAPLAGPGFGLTDLVRAGVLVADALGFDPAPPVHAATLPEIRSMLPAAAQYQFDPDPAVMKARITSQLNAFD
jgi:putative nucleotidyltransferase with HDIG domain